MKKVHVWMGMTWKQLDFAEGIDSFIPSSKMYLIAVLKSWTEKQM